MSSPTPSPLDDEIESLKARITTLKSHLQTQTSTILSSPSTTSLISNPSVSSTQLKQKGLTPTILKSLRHYASLQKAHNQQSLYRTCATITTFRVQDPDPNAVDGGAVLGLRVEVLTRGKFVRPYYVLMNRPYGEGRKDDNGNGNGKGKENGKGSGREKERKRKGRYANWLRVHRHTVPPCIPLSGLAARYLPSPPSTREDEGRQQDLVKFAKRLRRELVRYHHRLATISDLRRAIIAESKQQDQEEEGEGRNKVQDVIPADAEAKQITIEWEDGQTGRLVMGDDGEIVNVVALNGGQQSGRDREVVRELVGQSRRVEDVVRRLGSSGSSGSKAA
ncbi:Cenp-O kinetochore centromere component-domain-containing protein [Sordaria brevicollis]|uniref:Cenp-O kinetochore centromere component-domain-containing protein n=1 Tax=Sordaria brevicollis TaxID=83679 RepID=A0AAE0NX10_SORBR|nr:Cenp-O kinetochore centromere component-domain-containing protein [Sordaria brevicollis]